MIKELSYLLANYKVIVSVCTLCLENANLIPVQALAYIYLTSEC